MKTRIALLSGLLTLAAGVALATPTTQSVTAADQDQDLSAWDGDWAIPAAAYSLNVPTTEQEPVELAVYWPCGCIPRPGCPFPLPWPGGPIFSPLPIPGPCGPCPF